MLEDYACCVHCEITPGVIDSYCVEYPDSHGSPCLLCNPEEYGDEREQVSLL